MRRKTLLTITSTTAALIGLFAIVSPTTLIEDVKHATATGAAVVMTRTVGVLLVTMGFLAFSVRDHEDSKTLRSVLAANLLLQVAILPIDPIAYATGVFHTVGSFLPNTLLHVLLAVGFGHHLLRLRAAAPVEG